MPSRQGDPFRTAAVAGCGALRGAGLAACFASSVTWAQVGLEPSGGARGRNPAGTSPPGRARLPSTEAVLAPGSGFEDMRTGSEKP